ncbi:MAG: hypothetical protein V4629_03465 [Pseudomonadota bacterium]
MKKPTKAALLSLFVFPGTGHLLLKKYQRGLIWIGVTAALLIFLIKNIMKMAEKVIGDMDVSQGAIDINQIADAATQASLNVNPWVSVANWVVLIIWVVAAIDAYRIAKGKKIFIKNLP